MSNQNQIPINKILHGDALTQLKTLEAESIDCCITSPPYYQLRDYKTEGQLGLEDNQAEYIKKLVEIFGEVKRVLKSTGSCWVDMGDSYDGNKSLCLIPQRFSIAMVDAGWICRNTIIWFKPNCMPSSAKDRFTVDFEYLFFFTKSQRYYFDTQYEPLESYENPSGWQKQRLSGKLAPFGGNKCKLGDGYNNGTYSGNEWNPDPLGRIKRCVWQIPTQPFADAHFAVFPEALIETPIKASCPEYICKKCGKPREKIIKKEYEPHRPNQIGRKVERSDMAGINDHYNYEYGAARIKSVNQTGWDECNCNVGFDGGIVLDPFIGSGTVGVVAMQNARNFVGIELNQSYIDMALKRLEPYLKQERITSF